MIFVIQAIYLIVKIDSFWNLTFIVKSPNYGNTFSNDVTKEKIAYQNAYKLDRTRCALSSIVLSARLFAGVVVFSFH